MMTKGVIAGKALAESIAAKLQTALAKRKDSALPLAQLVYVRYAGFVGIYVETAMAAVDVLTRYSSAVDWQAELIAGKVKVFHYFIGPHYRVKAGDILIIAEHSRHAEPSVATQVPIIYEDQYMLAFHKPAPLPCHPTGGYWHNVLTRLLVKRGIHCHLLHRLDAETSGVLLAVKHAQDVKVFSRALALGEKCYRVLVYGRFPAELTVRMFLGAKAGSLVVKRQGHNEQNGKISETRFVCASTYTWAGQLYSLVNAYPLTGRTHQLRAHLCESGFPLVGDKIYGKDERYFLRFLAEGLTSELLAELELSRQFLHAELIRLYHPYTGMELKLRVPLSAESTLNALGTARGWQF